LYNNNTGYQGQNFKPNYQKPFNQYDGNKGPFQKKNQWEGFEASADRELASGAEMNKYKVKNTPVSDSTTSGLLKIGAAEFRPNFKPDIASKPAEAPVVEAPKPVPKVEVDKVAEKLKMMGQNSEDIAEVKAVLKELADNWKYRGANGVISLDLFKKVGELNICKTANHNSEDLGHCLNVPLISRTCVDEMKGKMSGGRNNMTKGRSHQGGHRPGHTDDNDFSKGTAKP